MQAETTVGRHLTKRRALASRLAHQVLDVDEQVHVSRESCQEHWRAQMLSMSAMTLAPRSKLQQIPTVTGNRTGSVTDNPPRKRRSCRETDEENQ